MSVAKFGCEGFDWRSSGLRRSSLLNNSTSFAPCTLQPTVPLWEEAGSPITDTRRKRHDLRPRRTEKLLTEVFFITLLLTGGVKDRVYLSYRASLAVTPARMRTNLKAFAPRSRIC